MSRLHSDTRERNIERVIRRDLDSAVVRSRANGHQNLRSHAHVPIARFATLCLQALLQLGPKFG